MERREGGEESVVINQYHTGTGRLKESFILLPFELCAVRRDNSKSSSILHVQIWVSPKSQWCIDLLYKS